MSYVQLTLIKRLQRRCIELERRVKALEQGSGYQPTNGAAPAKAPPKHHPARFLQLYGSATGRLKLSLPKIEELPR